MLCKALVFVLFIALIIISGFAGSYALDFIQGYFDIKSADLRIVILFTVAAMVFWIVYWCFERFFKAIKKGN